MGHKPIGYGFNIIMKSQILEEIINLVDILFQELNINKEKNRDFLTVNDLDPNCIRWSAGIIFLQNGCCGDKLPRKIYSCTECFKNHYLDCVAHLKKEAY